MAITDIVGYCAATQELSHFCELVGGFLVGSESVFQIIYENVFLYGLITVFVVALFLISFKLFSHANMVRT